MIYIYLNKILGPHSQISRLKYMQQPICFMIRNRAQGADMIDQVLMARRAFIGYPPHKLETNIGKTELLAKLYDLSKITDWSACRQNIIKTHGSNYARQVAGNLNLVRDAIQGSVLLVPRPDRGLVYAGTLKNFELLDDPLSHEWGEQYIQNRYKTGLNNPEDDMDSHVQDLAQSFLIKEPNWIEIPFISFPVWMQRTFYGRSTTARLRGFSGSSKAENLKLAFDEACRLMNDAAEGENANMIPKWSSDHETVKQRLRDRVSAESFEHLVVALLQLENPDNQWMQCGGSGDGGVDGIGTSSEGSVSILQCKWEYWRKKFDFGQTIHGKKDARRYFAYLNGIEKRDLNVGEGLEVLGPDEITSLVIKHSTRLPIAMSLRIRS